MTDEPENITRVYLRRLDANMDKVMEYQEDQALRLGRVESGLVLIRQEIAAGSEAEAHLQAQIDRLRERLDRIDRRLGLADE